MLGPLGGDPGGGCAVIEWVINSPLIIPPDKGVLFHYYVTFTWEVSGDGGGVGRIRSLRIPSTIHRIRNSDKISI